MRRANVSRQNLTVLLAIMAISALWIRPIREPGPPDPLTNHRSGPICLADFRVDNLALGDRIERATLRHPPNIRELWPSRQAEVWQFSEHQECQFWKRRVVWIVGDHLSFRGEPIGDRGDSGMQLVHRLRASGCPEPEYRYMAVECGNTDDCYADFSFPDGALSLCIMGKTLDGFQLTVSNYWEGVPQFDSRQPEQVIHCRASPTSKGESAGPEQH